MAYSQYTMDRLTDALVIQLEALPPDVFEKIRTTVNGDDDILVGTWIEYANDKLCGCLMCDGVTNAPEYVNWDLTELVGADSETVQEMLNEFYGLAHWAVFYDGLPRAFDAWAGALEADNNRSKLVPQRSSGALSTLTSRILSERGREELREIVASVVAGKRAY